MDQAALIAMLGLLPVCAAILLAAYLTSGGRYW